MVSLINALRAEAERIGAWTEDSYEVSSDNLLEGIKGHLIPYNHVCLYVVRRGATDQSLQLNFGLLLQDASDCIICPSFEAFSTEVRPLSERSVEVLGEEYECTNLGDLVNRLLPLVKNDIRFFYLNFNGYKIIPLKQLPGCLTDQQKKWFRQIAEFKCCTIRRDDRIMDMVLLGCDHMVHRNCIQRLRQCPECLQAVAHDAKQVWYKKYEEEISKMGNPVGN